MRASHPLLALAAAALLASAGCVDPDTADVPAPLPSVPADVRGLSQTVGEYVATPRKELTKDELDATVRHLATRPGVQSAKLEGGQLRVVLRPTASKDERDAVLRQLAAVGEVGEGI